MNKRQEMKDLADLIASGKIKDKAILQELLSKIREYDAGEGQLDVNYDPYQLPDLSEEPIHRQTLSRSHQDLAARGVDVLTGLPGELAQITSLSITPEQRDEAIKQYYKRRGESTMLKVDDRTGMKQYYNPQTKRFTLIEPAMGFKPTVGGAMDLALEGIGGVVGAGLGTAGGLLGMPPAIGIPVGGVGGTMAGRAASEGLKAGIDKAFGLGANPSATLEEYTKDAAKDVVQSGAWAAAGELAFGGPKLLWKWGRAGFKPMNYKEASRVLSALRENEDLLAQYNQLFPDNPIDLNAMYAAYINAPPEEKVAIGTLLQKYISQGGKDPEFRVRAIQDWDENLSALESSFAEVADRMRPQNVHPEDPRMGDRAFRSMAQQETAATEAGQLRAGQNARRERGNLIADLPSMTEQQTGHRLMGIVSKEYDDAVKATDATWKDFYKELGVDPMDLSKDRLVRAHYVPSDSTRVMMDDQLYTELNNYLEQALRSGLSKDVKYGPIEALPEIFIRRSPTGRKEILPNIKSMDSMQIINELKNLRLGIRRQNAASKGLTFTADDEAQVADILERHLFRQWKEMGKPGLIAKYEQAKFATQRQKEMFEDSALRDLLTKRGGRLPATDYTAIARIFYRNDPQAAKDLRTILNGSPEALNDVRKMLLAIYRRDFVGPDGQPIRNGFNKFKKEYGDAMREFFGDEEWKTMSRLGAMDEAVVRADDAYRAWKQKWNNQPLARYARANSQDISDVILKNSKVSPVEVFRTTQFLKETDPAMLEAIRYSTARKFANQVTGPDGSPLVDKMDRIFAERGLHLKAILGEEWYSNMRMLQAVTRSMDMRPITQFPANEPPATLKAIIRAAFIRPLSREGLIQTMGYINRRRAASRLWYNAVKDPKALALYIENLNKDPRTVAGAGILTALGAAGWEEDNEE